MAQLETHTSITGCSSSQRISPKRGILATRKYASAADSACVVLPILNMPSNRAHTRYPPRTTTHHTTVKQRTTPRSGHSTSPRYERAVPGRVRSIHSTHIVRAVQAIFSPCSTSVSRTLYCGTVPRWITTPNSHTMVYVLLLPLYRAIACNVRDAAICNVMLPLCSYVCKRPSAV